MKSGMNWAKLGPYGLEMIFGLQLQTVSGKFDGLHLRPKRKARK